VMLVPAAGQSTQPPVWPDPPHELLILGTFHFRDAGLDNYRPQFDIDIMSPARQDEVQSLVDRLVMYAPTRVAVEVQPSRQAWLDSLFSAYRAGSYELGSNEVFQIGFRLAARLGHERVYAVDAVRRFYEPWVDPDSFAIANGQEALLDPALEAQYTRLHEWEDARKTQVTLAEYLLYLNDPQRALRSHGQYLIGNFEVGQDLEFPGVDSKTAWFNRNLKIFANLQRLVQAEQERLLLIIGAGHLAILRHSAQASPQFQLVELPDVLRRE